MSSVKSGKDVHLSGYQRRDIDIVDYQMYDLQDTGLSFRGPVPADLSPGSYFVCLGAAQTFGCFCQDPYPAQLEKALGLPALNLGYGGAGPEFFAQQKSLLPLIKNARFVVLQVMSGRSQSNPYYECGGLEYVTRRADGKRMGALEAYKELMSGPSLGGELPIIGRYARALSRRLAVGETRRVVEDARAQWVANFQALCDEITVPKVLFWFSKRKPAYQESYKSVFKLFNEYPQLVDDKMTDAVKAHCDHYVECVSERGSPQPLFHKDTGEPAIVHTGNDREDLKGEPWTHNKYYPSPQMHDDAFAALEPVCRDLLKG